MESFFGFMKVAVITISILVGLFIVLLAIPQSRPRGITLQIIGWVLNAFTGLCVLYIISPIDLIPDIIPILGQVDDAGTLITAIFSGIAGIICVVQGRRSLAQLSSSKKHLELED